MNSYTISNDSIMTASSSVTPSYSPITTLTEVEAQWIDGFGNTTVTNTNTNTNTNPTANKDTSTKATATATTAMSKSSSDTDLTVPTVLTSDLNLIECESFSVTGSLSSGSINLSISHSNSNSISHSNSSGSHSASASYLSGRSLPNIIANTTATANGNSLLGYAEEASIETPIHKTPYATEERRFQNLEPYVHPQDDLLIHKSHDNANPSAISKPKTKPKTKPKSKSRRIPKVTSASVPFQKTIPPTSCLRDELAKDPAYRHALKSGTLWQSLVAQHVKLPALWYDGEEPARPYLGCEDPLKRNRWSYFGRHRVAGDPKLNALIKHSFSSGKLLLHIVCRDSQTLEPMEDIVVGVFHPNAEGIREETNANSKGGQCQSQALGDNHHQRHEDCRDVWIGHRSRRVPHQGRRIATRIESLLRYLHKNKVDKSPLGDSCDDKSSSSNSSSDSRFKSKRSVDNTNMNSAFGSRPPRHTLFVMEDTLHDLLMPRPQSESKAPSPPASVVLLRAFLR